MKDNKVNQLLTQFLDNSTGFVDSEEIVNYIFEQVQNIEKIELFKEILRKNIATGIKTFSNATKRNIVSNQRDLFEFEGALAVFGGVVKTEHATEEYLLAHKENSNLNRQRVDKKDDELNEKVKVILDGMFETKSLTVGEWQKIEQRNKPEN